MTIGAYTRDFPGQVWDRDTNDWGTWKWFPIGPKLIRSWSGNDSPRQYSVQALAVPREPFVKKVRQRDGSIKEIVKHRPPKIVRKRIYSRGFRPPNAFSSDNRRWVNGILRKYSGTPPYVNAAVWQLAQGGYVPSFLGASIFTSNDQLDLISKLSERIQDTDFSASVSLAEIDKTCNMIADRAKNLARSIAYLRKGNYREALRVISGYGRPNSIPDKRKLSAARNASASAGARVLEVQYGWKPLVTDMYEGAVWLAALQQKPNSHRFLVRKRRIAAAANSGAGVWYANPSTEMRRQIIAYLEESSFAPTLNLWNPAEVLWERTPYSFLCDWALPIGSYLAARGIASKLKGTFVTTDTLRKRCNGPLVASPQGSVEYTKLRYFYSEGAFTPYWSEDFVTRTVSSSLSVPLPSFKGLGQIASWQHCLNAVSLLVVAGKVKPDDVLRSAGRL